MWKILQILPVAVALSASAQPPPIPPGRLDSVQTCENGGLYLHTDGNFYGVTEGQGRHPKGFTYYDGTIFKLSPDGKLTGLAVFPSMYGSARGPDASRLVADDQGRLWGALSGSGAAACGTIYRFDPASSTITTVIEFTGNEGTNTGKNPYPKLIHDGKGLLWGVTREGGKRGTGTAFILNTRTGKLTCLAEFDYEPGTKSPGRLPTAGALSSDGKYFWGTLVWPDSGSVFRIDTSSGVYETVAKFGTDAVPGSYPGSGVVSDGKGFIWGTTLSGGKHNHGTVFKIDEKTGKFTSVVQFGGYNANDAPGEEPHTTLVSDGKGFMWGTTDGGAAPAIFRINAATGEMKRMAELPVKAGGSARPHLYAALSSDGKGTLWGTTSSVPSSVFKIDTDTGKLTTVVEFPGDYGKQISR